MAAQAWRKIPPYFIAYKAIEMEPKQVKWQQIMAGLNITRIMLEVLSKLDLEIVYDIP